MRRALAYLRQPTLAALAIILGLVAPAADADRLDDAAIIAIYNQVNSIDIETALVGQVKGHSPEVRELAEMVATDHTGVRKAAHQLSNKIGVTPKLPVDRAEAAKAHYDVIESLRAKSGPDFDRAYLLHELEFHRTAMETVKNTLLPAAHHPELKAHFSEVLPHFMHHLNETIRVAKNLGVE